MNEHEHRTSASRSMRERELELEIARLTAQLEAAHGSADPTDVTARLLAMAATTVDQAMADARREADDLAAEVTADAEARRDEAARLAAEAQARTDQLRVEAEQHEEIVAEAHTAAAHIRQQANREAESLVATERDKVVDEIGALSDVRAALEEERAALESYHEQLRRRVQELAESMVSFMTTEPPLAAGMALDSLTVPELEEQEEAPAATPPAAVAPAMNSAPTRDSAPAEEPETVPAAAPATETAPAMDSAPADNSAMPIEEAETEVFGGAPVLGEPPSRSGGLFSRATEAEIEEDSEGPSLFGTHGARLIEQTSAEGLAAALEGDDVEDERFASFIAGDDESDPSRDWLLRPDQP